MRQFNYIWLCKNTWLMSSNTYMGEMENFVLCWREIFTTISWGFDYLLLSSLSKGVSRSCSYDSWIYNYLCNKCLSPLKLWVRILPRRGVLDTTLCDTGYSVSSTIITEILLNTIEHNKHKLLNIVSTEKYIQSSLSMWSPLLSSHLHLQVTFFLSCHRKCELNLF